MQKCKFSICSALLILSGLFLQNCTSLVNHCFLPPMRPFIDKEVQGLLSDLQKSLYEESDLETAKASLPATLKLLEGMILHYPEREDLKILAAMGFGFYAFAFLEPYALDPTFRIEERERYRSRASHYYDRGSQYAFQILEKRYPELASKIKTGLPKLLAQELETVTPDDVPALFWFTYGWAGWINLNRNSPIALTNIEKARLIVEKLLTLDRDYFYATPLLLAGSLYGGLPKFSGYSGDSQKFFDEAIQKTGGKFLMASLLKIMYLDMAFQTEKKTIEEGYKRAKVLLQEILDTPKGILPEAELANEIAKERARFLIREIDDFLAQTPYEIRLCTLVPKGTRWTDAMEIMNEEIKLKTHGQARLKIIPTNYDREEEHIKEELELGKCDAATFIMPMHAAEKAPAIYLLEMLLYYKSYDQISCFVRELYDIVDFQYEEGGYVLLNVLEIGLVYVYSRFDIPRGLKEIKDRNMKVWILKDHVYSERVVRELGITPNRNALVDVRSDLIKGNIDIVYASPLQLITSGWFSELAYMSEISQPIGNSIGATIVRAETWNRMPPEIRNAIKEVAQKTLDQRFFRQIGEDNHQSAEILKRDFGFKTVALSKEDFTTVQRANNNVIKYLLDSGKINQELYRRFQDIERICKKN